MSWVGGVKSRKESNSVRSQIMETVMNLWCYVWLSVGGLNKTKFANPKWDRIRCPEEEASPVSMLHPLEMIYGNLSYVGKRLSTVKWSWIIIKSDRWRVVIVFLSGYRMSLSIRERGTNFLPMYTLVSEVHLCIKVIKIIQFPWKLDKLS